MEIRRILQVILKLMTCTVGGMAAWLALSTFAPTLYDKAIEAAVLVKAWHCAAFGLVAGIGWAIGYKKTWGILILCALQGWAIGIGFQLLRYAKSPWLGYPILFLFLLALTLVLTGGGIFRKKEGVE